VSYRHCPATHVRFVSRPAIAIWLVCFGAAVVIAGAVGIENVSMSAEK
jgi:hypothetical protein